MSELLDLDRLLAGCADESFDDGILIETEMVPVAGRGAPVKPATYEGGSYQCDRRWASPDDAVPQSVIVIDNVPSQANRLEEQLRRERSRCGLPEIVLDLSAFDWIPEHLPRRLSSFWFPHRNADAYLRDATLNGQAFGKSDVGQEILAATPSTAGALAAWFPQALIYGFWQSHLGNKRTQTKHARAWVSEIIGWQPAVQEPTKILGLKGDPLNLNVEEKIEFDPMNQSRWSFSEKAKKKSRLSEIGHGQVPFTRDSDTAPAGVSFRRITQRAYLSFAHMRRISLGDGSSGGDRAVRALVVAMGLHAQVMAYGRGFELRSGAELRPESARVTWLSTSGDEEIGLGGAISTRQLLVDAKAHAAQEQVLLGQDRTPFGGWDMEPLELHCSKPLATAIQNTWPILED